MARRVGIIVVAGLLLLALSASFAFADREESRDGKEMEEKSGDHVDDDDKKEETKVGNCPIFSCSPGKFVPGKFTPDYGKTSSLQDVDREGFYMYSSYLDDPLLTNPQLECYKTCVQYNLENPAKTRAVYWQYEDTCEDNGGNCYCYGADACTGNHYDPKAHEDEYWSDETGGEPAANYTVGKICSSDGHGDPHFHGADGSRFDFSGR